MVQLYEIVIYSFENSSSYLFSKCFKSEDLKLEILLHCFMVAGNTFQDLGPNTVIALAPISVKVLGMK